MYIVDSAILLDFTAHSIKYVSWCRQNVFDFGGNYSYNFQDFVALSSEVSLVNSE